MAASKRKNSNLTDADYANIKLEIDAASFRYLSKYGI
jgi:hypothetical protein